MEHVVFFPAPDGAPVFRRVASIEDAVRLVEHLRNVEGVQEVAVHPLGAEVPLAFRAWYRVEVPGVAEQPVPEAALAAGPASPALVAVPEQAVSGLGETPEDDAVAEPVLVEAGANGHANDSGRSLGFFA